MRAIETVDVLELAPPCSFLDGLRHWRGFVELSPASEARPTSRWLSLRNADEAEWEWTGGIPAVPLAPIGCFFLQDVELSGAGYIFANGRFIRERTHTSDVAMNRINENYPGNPLDSRRSNQVIIEEPVLLITGAGNPTYGHWILDFLPRLVIALRLLSLVSDAIPILLPSGTPGWVGRMLRAYCGIDPDRIRIYSEQDDNVLCRHLCLPSFGHNGTYSLHKIVREFYTSLGNASRIEKQRRICLSRSSFSQGRVFTARDSLERIASSRGYEIVRPEELSFSEQADMYHSATCIVGEAGSGLHGSVFSKPGTIVASIGFNWIQAHVSGAFEQRLVSLDRLQSVQSARDEVQAFTAQDNDLVGLFDQIDRLQKESSSYSTAR